ncbi:type II toxin-antitoxin system Phd/YefM family antitoxin [Scytonema sp. NUACC26]|uniref:type II toxin-antitoxin system Phd/YefM family antitoxin n=1 Tax=Scytonema sp. NUACC26 TaxID=3140176 RepID=UPI0034DC150A
MNTIQLSQKVQFVINAEGKKSAVLLSLEDWEQLLTLLEDLEDAEEICQVREQKGEAILWEQAKAELGIEV